MKFTECKKNDGSFNITLLPGTIYNGKFVVIKGDKCSGKSLLVQMLSGISTPDSGVISDYNSRNIQAGIKTIYRPSMVVSTYLKRRVPDIFNDVEFAKEVIERLGVNKLSNKFVPDLTEKEYTKVLLCQTLAENKEYIFIDNNDNNLETIRVLRDYAHRTGNTVVVTNDDKIALERADQIINIDYDADNTESTAYVQYNHWGWWLLGY